MTLDCKWRYVSGTDGFYSVSNRGQVRSNERTIMRENGIKMTIREKLLSIGRTKKGYGVVVLYFNGKKKTRSVHRIVAEAFIPKIDGKNEVNHIDGNKLNNDRGNLEWVTASENQKHSFSTLGRSGSSKGRFGSENHLSKPVLQFDMEMNQLGEYSAVVDAGRITGISPSGIGSVCRGTRKTAGGYIWKFKK